MRWSSFIYTSTLPGDAENYFLDSIIEVQAFLATLV